MRENVDRVALRAGRDPGEISVVAVTKTVGLDPILEAVEAGVRHVGENRVQEAQVKMPHLPEGVTRHMVGHLQRNKVVHALRLFDLIHSLDRISLAQEISKRAEAGGQVVRVLVQVNTAGDEDRYGVRPEGARDFLEQVSKIGGIRVEGLMTIGPFTDDTDRIRRAFARIRELSESLKGKNMPGVVMEHLSMGMSGDYEIAIEEGATLIRVGTAIFGARPH